MLVVYHTFVSHALNVDLVGKPVVWRPRHSSLVHFDVVTEEVSQLLEADAIQAVQYHTWLANTIVVPKKNRKMWVCVDYTSLNDAFSKVFFHSLG